MITITEIKDELHKSRITEEILRQLPEWFGNEKSLLDYIDTVKDKIFYCAMDDDNVVGFLCLKFNNQFTADIYVTGILKEYHRRGIGRKLVQVAEKYLTSNGYKFFMVKTLGESSDYEFYKKTREFYLRVGFFPLEEFKEIWDADNPCLIMVKSLN